MNGLDMNPAFHGIMRRGVSLILGFAAALVLAEPADLPQLRTLYDTHIARFETEYNTAMDTWGEDYRRDVEHLIAAAQRAGNLDAWQIIQQEAERFSATLQIPTEPDPGTHEAVRALYVRYKAVADRNAQDHVRKVEELTARYLAHLGALQAAATRSGTLEDALAYRAESTRVQEVTDAITANRPVEQPATTAPPPTPSSSSANPPPHAAELPEGVIVSTGLTPPSVPGHTFRPLPMTLTERIRVTRRLSGQTEMSTVSERQRTSYSQSVSAHHVLRVGLRPAVLSESFEDATLVVEFYGRDAKARSAHIVPRPIGTKKMVLPKIEGTRWVFVQFPPILAENTSYNPGYFYSGYRSGMVFYGIVVSVFDVQGTLLYQAVSVPNLMSLAPESIPLDAEDARTSVRYRLVPVEE